MYLKLVAKFDPKHGEKNKVKQFENLSIIVKRLWMKNEQKVILAMTIGRKNMYDRTRFLSARRFVFSTKIYQLYWNLVNRKLIRNKWYTLLLYENKSKI